MNANGMTIYTMGLGAVLLLVAVLVPDVRSDSGSFGTLTGLAGTLIAIAVRSPNQEQEIKRLQEQLDSWKARYPSEPPPPRYVR